MKLIITILLFFTFGQPALAFEANDNITRIMLAASDKVEYESRFLSNPPRLIVKFKTANILGRLVEDAEINQGAIKSIEVLYYPASSLSGDSRRIKFLTFWLNEGSSYKIWDKGNTIYLDFKGPNVGSGAKEIEISEVVDIKEIGSKTRTVETLLSQFEAAAVSKTHYSSSQDILWILAFLLIGVHVLYFRPVAWRRFVRKLEGVEEKGFSTERRRHWRHSLAPLKDKAIYANISSSKSNTTMDFIPKDLGYGGVSFECNRLKKLYGELDIKLFVPDRILPVKLKGVIAWQRNNWIFLRKHVGVAFTTLPDREWSGINNYIEKQYATLNN